MERLTTEELEEIRKRAEQATEGPWMYEFAYGINITVDTTKSIEVVTDDTGVVRYSDAEFIANARTDIPKLLAEVERLNAVLDEEISEKEHVIMAQQMEIDRLYSKLNGGDA